MRDASDTDTVDFAITADVAGRRRGGAIARLQVDLAGLSHQGKVRPRNEDHFLTARFGRFLEPIQTNLEPGVLHLGFEEAGYAALLADGMGGAAAGDVASQLAITTLVDLVQSTPDWILRVDEAYAQQIIQRARRRAGQVQSALQAEAVADPALRGFGTTLTLAWSLGTDLFIAHVGDSRAYRLRGGSLARLTRDH